HEPGHNQNAAGSVQESVESGQRLYAKDFHRAVTLTVRLPTPLLSRSLAPQSRVSTLPPTVLFVGNTEAATADRVILTAGLARDHQKSFLTTRHQCQRLPEFYLAATLAFSVVFSSPAAFRFSGLRK